MKVGIVLGSTREGRAGESVANWVARTAEGRSEGAEYTLIDLKEFNVPILSSETVPAAAGKKYDVPEVQAWSDAIDACDAYIFVTPEYNHSVPGPFKNAFDILGSEWAGKAIAFVGYGSVGGVRAVEAWRLAVANFQMKQLRNQVDLNLYHDFKDGAVAPTDQQIQKLDTVLAELEELAKS